MSRRSSTSGLTIASGVNINSVSGDGPRPPPRRRAGSVAGQQGRTSSISSDRNNDSQNSRRSLSTVVS